MTFDISIRGGSGFGDSIYLQSVVRHFLAQGLTVEACSDFPDVFRQLTGRLTVSPFRRNLCNTVGTYTMRKHVFGTDQFQDCCLSAGIRGAVEFKLGWVPRSTEITDLLRRRMPIICVQLARVPMARSDGFGAEVAPDWQRIQDAIDALAGRAFLVQIGSGEPLFRFSGIDLDMANSTTVADVLDIAAIADGFLGYCSFLVPLAESQHKPALFVWSRRGLRSTTKFVSRITPQKVLHRKDTSRWVVDDCSPEVLENATRALYHAVDARCAV